MAILPLKSKLRSIVNKSSGKGFHQLKEAHLYFFYTFEQEIKNEK